MNTKELRKAAKCVFLACPEPVARDLSDKLIWAADELDKINESPNKKLEMDCAHNWVSGDNEVVSGVEVCTKCKKFRATTQL